jgi:hypothetical protein
MRGLLFACAAAAVLMLSAPPAHASRLVPAPVPTISAHLVTALQLPDKKIDVTIGEHGGAAWYRSPVWIAIGVLALIVLVMLIVMMTRSGGGGGTTIIRE